MHNWGCIPLKGASLKTSLIQTWRQSHGDNLMATFCLKGIKTGILTSEQQFAELGVPTFNKGSRFKDQFHTDMATLSWPHCHCPVNNNAEFLNILYAEFGCLPLIKGASLKTSSIQTWRHSVWGRPHWRNNQRTAMFRVALLQSLKAKKTSSHVKNATKLIKKH